MDFWTAIIIIVAIGVGSDFLKDILKKSGRAKALKKELSNKEAEIASLHAETTQLRTENSKLRRQLEEQSILADEAIATFGSRLERLKNQQAAPESKQARHKEENL
ncbi:MAG: hypothetical protein ACPGQS_05085 [Bradymonadia bacterium]